VSKDSIRLRCSRLHGEPGDLAADYLAVPLLLLSLTTVSGCRQAVRRTMQPWAAELKAELALLRTKEAKLTEIQGRLSRLGYSRGMPAEKLIAWVREDVVVRKGLLEERKRLRGRIEVSPLLCWRLSTDGRPFRQVSYEDLDRHKGAVVRYYTGLVASKGPVPIEVLARENLPGNIELVGTEYHSVALDVILSRVWFLRLHTSWPIVTPLPVNKERAERVHAGLESWFARNKGTLSWDAARGKYCAKDGGPFFLYGDREGRSDVPEATTRPTGAGPEAGPQGPGATPTSRASPPPN